MSFGSLHSRKKLHYPRFFCFAAAKNGLEVLLGGMASFGPDGQVAFSDAGPSQSFQMAADVDLLIEKRQGLIGVSFY